jgi:hypothetical protein
MYNAFGVQKSNPIHYLFEINHHSFLWDWIIKNHISEVVFAELEKEISNSFLFEVSIELYDVTFTEFVMFIEFTQHLSFPLVEELVKSYDLLRNNLYSYILSFLCEVTEYNCTKLPTSKLSSLVNAKIVCNLSEYSHFIILFILVLE